MKKLSLQGYKSEKKPIAKLGSNEQVLSGDASHINPKRILKKKPQSFISKIFGK